MRRIKKVIKFYLIITGVGFHVFVFWMVAGLLIWILE